MDTENTRDYYLIDTLTLSSFTGIKPATLKYWRSKKRGPNYVKLGDRVMYRSDVIDAWLEEGVVNVNEPVNA